MTLLKDPKTGKFMKGTRPTNGFRKGNIPHNKGRTKENYKPLNVQSEKVSGKKNPFYGKKHTEEHKQELSIMMKNRGTPYIMTEKIRKKMSKNHPDVSLDKNSNWRGGIAFEPYDQKWNNKFKRRIRKRDNQVCMACRVHMERLNRALDVHHVDYNKLNTFPQNCISLCRSCHIKTNLNREHWKTFFQAILTKNYGYEYSQEGEIKLKIGGINGR